MQRFLLTLQYIGTHYAGWQTQTNATGIQQVVEEALGRLCKSEVRVHAAGRTDAGVHALGQRAHADIPVSIDGRGLTFGLNDLLPHDIRVVAAEAVADDFHARFNAKKKTYVYRIWNESVHDVFHRETYAHVPGRLDVDAMREAGEQLVGHHDFRSFTVSEPEVSSTWRTIDELIVTRDGPKVAISVTADGFLRYMVRRIAGSLIEAGRGKLTPADLRRALEPEFREARWTAPANGLLLARVTYGD